MLLNVATSTVVIGSGCCNKYGNDEAIVLNVATSTVEMVQAVVISMVTMKQRFIFCRQKTFSNFLRIYLSKKTFCNSTRTTKCY